ncbi:MAG: bifunctional pyr operon transcriptional regulator/uracil phosphoribosyltransferase PyrR [Quisquiliibacterium sp.]
MSKDTGGTSLDAEAIYATLRDAVAGALASNPKHPVHLIGIHSGGAWLAERLHADLGFDTPMGTLSSAFHRDDYGRRGLPAQMKSSSLPFEIAGADILLVDDILYTGRTVRAALNELFDYGRPARVRLAVLLDRGGRELPIEAAFCGLAHPLPAQSAFVLARDPQGKFTLGIE